MKTLTQTIGFFHTNMTADELAAYKLHISSRTEAIYLAKAQKDYYASMISSCGVDAATMKNHIQDLIRINHDLDKKWCAENLGRIHGRIFSPFDYESTHKECKRYNGKWNAVGTACWVIAGGQILHIDLDGNPSSSIYSYEDAVGKIDKGEWKRVENPKFDPKYQGRFNSGFPDGTYVVCRGNEVFLVENKKVELESKWKFDEFKMSVDAGNFWRCDENGRRI